MRPPRLAQHPPLPGSDTGCFSLRHTHTQRPVTHLQVCVCVLAWVGVCVCGPNQQEREVSWRAEARHKHTLQNSNKSTNKSRVQVGWISCRSTLMSTHTHTHTHTHTTQQWQIGINTICNTVNGLAALSRYQPFPPLWEGADYIARNHGARERGNERESERGGAEGSREMKTGDY